MPAGGSAGASDSGKHGTARKDKKAKPSKKEMKAARSAAAKKAQATRKRNLTMAADEVGPRKTRRCAHASAPAPTRQEVNDVFGSDAGSDDGCQEGNAALDIPGNELDQEETNYTGEKNNNGVSAPRPRTIPPLEATAPTGGSAGGRDDGRNTAGKAPSSSPRASSPPSVAARTGGKKDGGTAGRTAGRKPPASSPRVPPPLLAAARTGGTNDGRTTGRKAPASSPRVQPPPLAAARTGGTNDGSMAGSASKGKAPASSPRASTPLSAEAPTGSRKGGGTGCRDYASTAPASSPHALSPPLVAARTGGRSDGGTGGRANAGKVPASSPCASTPLCTEGRTGGGKNGGTGGRTNSGKAPASSPRVLPPPLAAARTGGTKDSGTGGRAVPGQAPASSPRALSPPSAAARTGGRNDDGTGGRANTGKAPASSPLAFSPPSALARTGGRNNGHKEGRVSTGQAPASSPRALSPPSVAARMDSGNDGGTGGLPNAKKAPASSPCASPPLAATARTGGGNDGDTAGRATASEAPTQAPRASPLLVATEPTGGSADGARANHSPAGSAHASSTEAKLALRSSTPVVTTAWPERGVAVFGNGSRSVGEQETIAAASEAACVAVAGAALGELPSEGTAAAVGATCADAATAAAVGGAWHLQPQEQGAAKFRTGVIAPAFPGSSVVAAPTSTATAHPQAQIAPQSTSLIQRQTALPSISGPAVSNVDEDCQAGPSTPALPPFGAFGYASAVYERPLFPGSEFLYDGASRGRGDTWVAPPGPSGGGAASAGLGPVLHVPVEAPAEFPPVQDISLQGKYAAERHLWRKHFSEWGVSWEDDVQAVMVELFTRAKDITPSYIIHLASSKSMCDAPATRDGVQEWFSSLLNAAVQGAPAAVAQPLCRIRTAHVLKVITAAYAKCGFSLPESVNARPTADPGGRQPANNKIMPAPEDRPCLPSSSCARRGVRKRAAPAEVEDDDVARCRSPKRKSVAKVEDVGALDSKGRHDRTMFRMMTAVGIILKYYDPDTEKWPSVHEVFVRMPLDILQGMSEPSIGLMMSCWPWARRGNKGREERTYDRLLTLALTKPGVTTATEALQYV